MRNGACAWISSKEKNDWVNKGRECLVSNKILTQKRWCYAYNGITWVPFTTNYSREIRQLVSNFIVNNFLDIKQIFKKKDPIDKPSGYTAWQCASSYSKCDNSGYPRARLESSLTSAYWPDLRLLPSIQLGDSLFPFHAPDMSHFYISEVFDGKYDHSFTDKFY